MSSEHAIFIFDGMPRNHIKVCIQSLRRFNKTCNIYFYYSNPLMKFKLRGLDIVFIKIDQKIAKGRPQFYKILMAKNLICNLPDNHNVLVLDNDLLFQDDPFIMFKEFPGNDFYFTKSILATPDSLRPEKIWKSVKYFVNGGVYGLKSSMNSRKLMTFWVDNLYNEEWEEWINFELRLKHLINGKTDLKWFIDQDFLNCLVLNEPPIKQGLKKVNVGYKYNYFTSTWGYFHPDLNMGNKIGNKNFVIIHFKDQFKDIYNVDNSRIFNMKNILLENDLTTKKSREKIYKKFLSRGKARLEVV